MWGFCGKHILEFWRELPYRFNVTLGEHSHLLRFPVGTRLFLRLGYGEDKKWVTLRWVRVVWVSNNSENLVL